MTEKTPDEILELAQQRITLRREEERLYMEREYQEQADRERPWRYAFLAATGVLLVGLLLTPGMPLDQKMAVVLQGMCSQQHNIVMGGLTFPICARCSGIYISMLFTLAYMWALGRGRAGRIPPWSITITLILFVAFIGVDGINSMVNEMGVQPLYQPRNDLRIVTGIGLGIGIGVLILIMLNLSLRKNVDDTQPVIRNWLEFGGLLGINFLLLAALYGNLSFMAWPLAILAFVGMIAVIFFVFLILISLFMGYDASIIYLSQLAKPATLALIPTVILIAGMSYLRHWLESQGFMGS